MKTAKLTTRSSWIEYSFVMRGRQPFRTYGALRSTRERGTVGVLPEPYRTEFLDCPSIDYVVYSYNTPIAWHSASGWIVPDVKYSVTTSRHQSKIEVAVHQVAQGVYRR